MMTNLRSIQALAWSLVFALFAFGCSDSGGTGSVDPCLTALHINLEVGGGFVIDEVEYEISGNGMDPMGDTIDTSAPGSTASVEQFGIPPGERYLVKMMAHTADGTLACGGAETFDVGAGMVTNVDLLLRCKVAQEFGGVRVNGDFNICAELEKVVVKPLQTSSGYGLSVEALASDSEGDTVEYEWSATGGSFENPDLMKTVFICGEPGEEQILIEVSDDEFRYCIDEWTVDVTCVEGDGSGGTGGMGGNAGGGGHGGMGGNAGGGGHGGMGGNAGGGGHGGNAGSGGHGGSAGGGGTAGSGGGSAGNGGTAGSGGSGIPPECLVSLSVQ